MKKLITIITLCTCLAFAGCAAKRANTTNTTPITQNESLNYYNVQIAAHNRLLGKSLIAIHRAGFLDTEYFDKLTRAHIQITRAHKDLTPLLKSQASAAANKDKISTILGEIQSIAAQMVTDGTVGIKNPDSKSAVLSDITAIVSSANSIYSMIESLQAVK